MYEEAAEDFEAGGSTSDLQHTCCLEHVVAFCRSAHQIMAWIRH